jgi:hypothetical protein
LTVGYLVGEMEKICVDKKEVDNQAFAKELAAKIFTNPMTIDYITLDIPELPGATKQYPLNY